ncbi:MAG: gamma carbonic anhydrase family protein, partial [Flavobacteriales bacterium]|nr:gamma carbonic anhydrase family protein [Flavobacteriales bacterium]
MALIKVCRGKKPQFGDDCYLAENSTIIGDVTMGNQCSVWFNAVIRGDV